MSDRSDVRDVAGCVSTKPGVESCLRREESAHSFRYTGVF